MIKIELKLRNMTTGEQMFGTFETEVDAETWLRDRPQFIDVLGVVNSGLPDEVGTSLRAALRPMDDEEIALIAAQRKAREDAARAEELAEIERQKQENAAHLEKMANLTPDAPMAVIWTRAGGIRIADEADTRPISDLAEEALLAWVRERDSWVHNRGQVVDEAQVTLWPATLPSGEDRVHEGGQFFPIVKD